MENLETYIAFDLEFNTVDGVSHYYPSIGR